jgi:pimeloyl-ACP methyl ester carboxylesterase
MDARCGVRHPDRTGRLALLAPSLAWKRQRMLAPLDRPECRAAPGVDEFLRAFLTPAGKAAFYAAARHIYLEAPDGSEGFWPRLRELPADALFIWGRRDRLVPIAFAWHVAGALPAAPAYSAALCSMSAVRAPTSQGPEMSHVCRDARGDKRVRRDRLRRAFPVQRRDRR